MITALRLRNFKAFRDIHIGLAPLSLLSGLNSSGKSTVLQSLALLRQSQDEGVLADEGWLLNGPLIQIGTGSDLLFEDALEDQISIEIVTDRGSWHSTVGYKYEADVLGRISQSPDNLDCYLGQGFQYLRADRVEPMVHYVKSYQNVARKRVIGCKGEWVAHFLSVHRDQPIAEPLRHPSVSSAGLLSQVNAWLSELSPGVELDVHEVGKTDHVRLSFTYGKGVARTNDRRPTNVGFGLTYVLPILVACLMATEGDLILVENPEAHLHPRGQSAIGRLMCSAVKAGAQMVVESHSDHVFNGIRIMIKKGLLRPETVAPLFFRRSNKMEIEIDRPSILPTGRLSYWPVDFFDEWDRSVEEILQ